MLHTAAGSGQTLLPKVYHCGPRNYLSNGSTCFIRQGVIKNYTLAWDIFIKWRVIQQLHRGLGNFQQVRGSSTPTPWFGDLSASGCGSTTTRWFGKSSASGEWFNNYTVVWGNVQQAGGYLNNYTVVWETFNKWGVVQQLHRG